MGWFSDLWDTVKTTAGNIWSGVKNVASTVYDTVRKPIDWVASAANSVKDIPILGTFAQPIANLAGTAQGYMNQARSIGDAVKAVGLKDGGVVLKEKMEASKPKKFYQAE